MTAKKPTKGPAPNPRIKTVHTPHASYEVEFSTRGAIKHVWETDEDDLFEENPKREDILPLFPPGRARELFLDSIHHAVNQKAEVAHINRTQGQLIKQVQFEFARDELTKARLSLAGLLRHTNSLRPKDAKLSKLQHATMDNLRNLCSHLAELENFDSPNPAPAKAIP